MTANQLKEINKVAEKIRYDFIVSGEDNSVPYVKITKDKAYIYAGYEMQEGEYQQQLYTTLELNNYDKEELIEDAAGWLLAEIFYNHFKASK